MNISIIVITIITITIAIVTLIMRMICVIFNLQIVNWIIIVMVEYVYI